MQEPIKKFFDNGLDADSAEFLVPPNSFISGKNFRIGTSEKGGFGFIENILQNAEKAHTLPAGTNTRIGFATDDENGFIVKFNQNSNGDDGIYLYDIVDDLWYTVLLSDDVTGGLNFSKYLLINGAYIINNILYWNDNNNEPRKLHLGAFIAAYGQSPLPSPIETVYTPTFPIDETEITLIRKPAPYPPAIQKLYDSGFSNNFIGNESYQLAVRLVHFEGEEAVLSGWSKSSLLNTSSENFNYIHVILDNTETVPQTVRLVQLIVKDGSTGKGFVAKQWDRLITDENTLIEANALYFDFYGNITGEQVDDATMVRPFHSVPFQAGTQERGKNRTLLADNLEGLDTPDTTSLELSLPSPISLGFTTLNKTLISIKHRRIIPLTDNPTYAYSAWYVLITEVLPVGYYALTATEQTVTPSFIYPTLPSPPVTVAYTGLTWRGATIQDAVKATRPGTNQTFGAQQEISTTGYPCSVTGISTDTYNVYLPQSQHKGAVTFYDRYLRKCGAITNEQIIGIPPRNYAFSSGYGAINWTLSYVNALAEIPLFAYYYSVDLSRNLRTPYFIASFDNAVRYATKNATTGLLEFTATTFAANIVAVGINANALLQANLGWNATIGDQCILIDNSDNRYELPIIGSEGDYFLLKATDVGNVSAKTWVYEFYVPYKSSEQEPFFQMGELFTITDSGTVSRNYETLFGSFRPSTFVLTRSYNATTYFAEVMCPNDVYFQRWDTDEGRPNLITKLGQVRKPTGVSFSNIYIQGTQTNGLSAFEALNKRILPEDMGTIRKLIETSKVQKDGNVILAIGEQETASIYLGETEVFDAEGNSFLAKSDEFIGQVNILRGSFGTHHPESVVPYKGQVAWFDISSSCFVRYDNNGLFPISDYGMKRVANLFAKKLATLSVEQIEALGSRPFVFGGVDPYNEEFLFSIPSTEATPPKGYLEDYVSPDLPVIYPYDIYDGIGKVLVFRMKQDRWGAPHEYQADGFVDIQELLYSSKNGKLYKHNNDNGTSNTYSSFYGTQVNPAIGFILNELPNIIKEFITLSIEGNTQPSWCHIRTENINIQSSDIVGEWVDRENVKYTAILRDRLSPNVSGLFADKLFTGDKMRGNWAKIYVEFTTNQLIQIRFFNIGVIKSLGHTT